MTMNKILFVLISLLCFKSAMAQQKSILYTGLTVHIGNGKKIEGAFVGVRDGQFDRVQEGIPGNLNALYDSVIDLSGKHMYPGFIALNSSIGLREIDAVRATWDASEIGELNPHIRSLPAYNADSKIIPTVRSNGVLSVQAVPSGGVFSGLSSVFHLDGWNWEDALFAADEGLHLNWPEYPASITTKDTVRTIKIRRKQEEIVQLLAEAKAYGADALKKERNIRLETLYRLFSGASTLYIHCNTERSIGDALLMLGELGIKRIVLVGAHEAYKKTALIKSFNVPVVLSRLHRLPDYTEQATDWPFRLPALLKDSGITVALSYTGDMEAMGTRNLAFTAGTAAAYGCSAEEALQMITLNPAKILGIDNYTGSIEVGKNADFFISEGDSLDMRTCKIFRACITGKVLDLNNHQKELYLKYSKKYGLSNP